MKETNLRRGSVSNDGEKLFLLSANICVLFGEFFVLSVIGDLSATAVVNEITNELDFVKDQITTTEVNIAHVYNYGVQLKKVTTTKSK